MKRAKHLRACPQGGLPVEPHCFYNKAQMVDEACHKLVDDFLGRHPPPLGSTQECPYLPDRKARHRGFASSQLPAEFYHALMDRGFRRSGKVFYRPACPSCQACIPIRIPVEAFRLSRSQRRVWAANQDVRVEFGEPQLTSEKWRLYVRYLRYQHRTSMGEAYEDLYNFLYDSPVCSVEFCYYLEGDLVGVSVADQSRASLSSVYMYFDPQLKQRSLGTYSILHEIHYCRDAGIPYYYLGFYVEGCGKMSYKAKFGPHEMLAPDGQWVGHQ